MKKIILALLMIFAVGAASGQPLHANEFDSIVGRWLRPDGGYVLVINDVTKAGEISAEYLNPRSINISEARASLEDGKINIFIELKDTYYPGSYYTLSYDPTTDRRVGVYHHLGINQDFDVYFIRQ